MPIENNPEQIAPTEARHAVIEIQPHLDKVIFDEVWQAAVKGDNLLVEHLLGNRKLQSRMFPLHVFGCLGFAVAAKFFLCEACRQDGAFCLSLSCGWAAMFAIMVPAGFFVRDGFRYKLAVPRELTFDVVGSALSKLHETEDSEGIEHPEQYLYTMSRDVARVLCEDLRKPRSDGRRCCCLVENGASAELG
jgi:hypothetical protein